jgi:diguanylate cyclase (GGDEF)-like protein
MELLLWRWSTTAQVASSVLLAVFFIILARSVKRVELRPWVNAWTANLGALLVTIVYWYAQPGPRGFLAVRFGYFFFKTLFVLLLAVGARRFVSIPSRKPVPRGVILGAALFAVVAGVTMTTIDLTGSAGALAIAVVLGYAGFHLLIHRSPGAGWLIAGFLLRALLAVVESVAHLTRVVPNPWRSSKAVGVFLAAYSSFDTGVEWAIALGCVLILYRTIQSELTSTNRDLIATQAQLQDLADRDSLTGLLNRRALPTALRQAFDSGATLLFFDLNDFKDINDSYGHHAGDDALKRFARALQASFRPTDDIFRHAGDEFVVVARGSEPHEILDRIDRVRERLRFDTAGPRITFSVGHSYLPVHGEPEAALRAADTAMYEDKRSVKLRGA